jgi:hypothetical protein
MEGSHSGLVRHLGKVVWEKSHRGFKSLTLHHLILLHNKFSHPGGLFRRIIGYIVRWPKLLTHLILLNILTEYDRFITN